MATKDKLLQLLKEVNLLVLGTNKQMEGTRLLHDSCALANNGVMCDRHRETMHMLLDASLDQTAEQQRLVRLINLAGKTDE